MAYGMWKAGAAAFVLVGAGLFAGLGCNDGPSGVANAKLPEGVRSEVIVHEDCDEKSNKVEVLDANNDGKPDIRRVYKDGREICRISDLNHDGKPDMFEYYDAQGQVRRREADYDDNGVVNAIEIYENGKLVRRELDTTNQGRIDTWDYFDPGTGNRTKRERDANGDGRIDQWWTYETDKVSIAMDRNGDGQPDPDNIITLNAAGAVISGDAGAVSAPSDAGAAPPPPAPTAPTLSMPSLNEPEPPKTDAGTAGKPQRGGAKR
ncbi:MAG: hypothetical protein JST00_11180 [Deltaproteobacteria bacterium]|nr:hypothetical protein [Deltaproteobacteria bacterium]